MRLRQKPGPPTFSLVIPIMFGTEVRPHHSAAQWPSLATDVTASSEFMLAVLVFRGLLPPHLARELRAPCGWRRLSTVTSFCLDAAAEHSTYATHHYHWRRLRSRCSSRLERSAAWRHRVVIAVRLQLLTSLFSRSFWHLSVKPVNTVTPSIIFPSVVKCFLSFFRLYAIIIIFVHNNNDDNDNNKIKCT